jgi:hypothetical protein
MVSVIRPDFLSWDLCPIGTPSSPEANRTRVRFETIGARIHAHVLREKGLRTTNTGIRFEIDRSDAVMWPLNVFAIGPD